MIEWTDTIIQGLLLGGLYALFATGLSLTFGIMRMINIAPGDFIPTAGLMEHESMAGMDGRVPRRCCASIDGAADGAVRSSAVPAPHSLSPRHGRRSHS